MQVTSVKHLLPQSLAKSLRHEYLHRCYLTSALCVTSHCLAVTDSSSSWVIVWGGNLLDHQWRKPQLNHHINRFSHCDWIIIQRLWLSFSMAMTTNFLLPISSGHVRNSWCPFTNASCSMTITSKCSSNWHAIRWSRPLRHLSCLLDSKAAGLALLARGCFSERIKVLSLIVQEQRMYYDIREIDLIEHSRSLSSCRHTLVICRLNNACLLISEGW